MGKLPFDTYTQVNTDMKRPYFTYVFVVAYFILGLSVYTNAQTLTADPDSLLQDSTNKFVHETQSNRGQANEAVQGSGNAESIQMELRKEAREARQEARIQRRKAREARRAERASRQAERAKRQAIKAEEHQQRAEREAAKAQRRAERAREKANRHLKQYYNNNQ